MKQTYKTKAEALADIQKIDTGIYFLHHGEYERPSYSARKVRGDEMYYIHVKRYYYSGTFYPHKSGPLTREEVARTL